MASIRKRGTSYQVRVTRKGFPPETKSFTTKNDAERWARSVESSMDEHLFVSNKPAGNMLFGALLCRYRETVTPLKRGARDEAIRLRALERRKIARLAVANVTPRVVADFRDERLKECCAGTVIRDLAVLSSIFSHAQREWGIGTSNPVALVRKPSMPQGRDRVLSGPEEDRLLHYARPQGRRSLLLHPLLILALETAMRRGEMLGMNWADVHMDRAVIKLPLTKNGTARWVPLSSRAVAALASLERSSGERVFQISIAALHQMFRRLCKRADVNNFRFHDLRHTATTKLALKLPNVIELAAVTGHRSIQMLKRYYHPSAESLAIKLG